MDNHPPGTQPARTGRGHTWPVRCSHHVARMIRTVHLRDTAPSGIGSASPPPPLGEETGWSAGGPVSPPSGGSTARFGRGGGRCPTASPAPRRRGLIRAVRSQGHRPLRHRLRLATSPAGGGNKTCRSRFSPQRGEYRPLRAGRGAVSAAVCTASARPDPDASGLWDTAPSGFGSASPPPPLGEETRRHACGPVSPPSGGSTARFGRGGGRCPRRVRPRRSRPDLGRPASGTPPPPASAPPRHLPRWGRRRVRSWSRFSPQRGEYRPLGRGGGRCPTGWHRVARRDLGGPALGHRPLRLRLRLATSPAGGGDGCVACGPVSPPSGGSTARFGRGGGRCPTGLRRSVGLPVSPPSGGSTARSGGEGGGVRPVAPRLPRDRAVQLGHRPLRHRLRLATSPAGGGDGRSRLRPVSPPSGEYGPFRAASGAVSASWIGPLAVPFLPPAGGVPPASGGEGGGVRRRCTASATLIWAVRSQGHRPLRLRLRLATSPAGGGNGASPASRFSPQRGEYRPLRAGRGAVSRPGCPETPSLA